MLFLKVAHKLYLSLAVSIVGFLVFGVFLFGTLNLLKINGPIYHRVIEGKDLVADILPPPVFIIESFLATEELLDNLGSEAATTVLIDRLRKLRSEFDARIEHWAKDAVYLSQMRPPAPRCWKAAETQR